MKNIHHLFLCCAGLLLAWGCGSDDDITETREPAQMVVAQSVYNITASGGTWELRVNSNVELTTETDVDWIRRLPDTRAWSVKTLRFEVAENTGNASREGTVTIVGDEARQSVKVIQTGKEESEREALTALYRATGGDAWAHHDNWCSSKPLSEWYGVALDDAGQVTSLRLGSNQLTGSLPDEISRLTALTYLNLNDNNLEGTLPASLDRLTNLATFYFGLNRLTGDIPQCITEMAYWPANGSAEIVQQTGCHFNFATTRLKLPAFSKRSVTNSAAVTDDLLKEQPLTLVYFWSTSYNYDAGTVATLSKAYKDNGLNVLAINNDGLSDSELLTAIRSNGMDETWYHISADKDWRFYPSLFLFDSTGECLYYSMVKEAIGATLEALIRERLGEGTPMYESADYSRDGEYEQLQAATEGRGINLVFLGEAFADTDIESGLYGRTMTAAMEEFFSIEPYKSFRKRFNVYTVYAVSPNNEFRTGAVHAIGENDATAFGYARKVPGIDGEQLHVAVIYNTQGYLERSVASWYDDGSYVAYVMEDIGRATLIHEAGGHGFAHLMDEYVEPGNEALSLPDDVKSYLDAWWRSGEYGANVDWRSDPAAVRWAHFLSDSRYADERLGVYEGAYFYGYGCYRPSENSMMRECSVGIPFNAPSREQIYKVIMRLSEPAGWTYSYEAFTEYDAVNRNAAVTRALNTQPASRTRYSRHRAPVHAGSSWREAVGK